MEYLKALALVLPVMISFAGCSDAQRPESPKRSKQEQKILIVYLSRTNNTKAVAEFIHDEVGGTIVPIEPEKPYPADYRQTVDQVARENGSGFLPPLKTKIEGIGQYDIVFVGFPTWGMQLPPPVKSFLSQHNLKGKTVVPFNTNAGYGVGTSIGTIKNLCSGSTVLDAFVTTGGIERDGIILAIKNSKAEEVRVAVRDWLKRINITQTTTDKK